MLATEASDFKSDALRKEKLKWQMVRGNVSVK